MDTALTWPAQLAVRHTASRRTSRSLPFASSIVAVSVCAFPAAVEPLSVSEIPVAGPCVYVTPAVAASAEPLSVPVTVALPTVVGEVSVAV